MPRKPYQILLRFTPDATACPRCENHRAWVLADGWFKCRTPYTHRSFLQSARFSERVKRKLLDYFVLGVLAYKLRFRGLASRPGTEKDFRLANQVISLAEEITAPFEGTVEYKETCFGGYRAGMCG